MNALSIVQSCAVWADTHIGMDEYNWCGVTLTKEYKAYLHRHISPDSGVEPTYESFVEHEIPVFSPNEYTLLFILNKYNEYSTYLMDNFENTPENLVWAHFLAELTSNLYIERLGGVIHLFRELTKVFDCDAFMQSPELDEIAVRDYYEATRAYSGNRDIMSGQRFSMDLLSPTILSGDEYRSVYEALTYIIKVNDEE